MAQITLYGILSYPSLVTPRSVNPGDDPKYSAVLLIPKGDPQLAQLQQLIETDKANGWPNGFPHNGKVFLKDCAVESPDQPQLAGYMEVRTGAKADQRPATVDMNCQPIIDPAQMFAGALVHVAINTFTYNNPVNKGVAAGLNGVMFTGEVGPLGRLDGRPSAEQMFAGVAGMTPAAAPTAPAAMVPPAAPAAMAPPAAPAAPAAMAPPAPPAPPAAPAPTAVHQMTPAANGVTYEAYRANGWSDEQLIQNGLMLPPGGVVPSFG